MDGAGTWYTYFRNMLVNAVPAVITVSVFHGMQYTIRLCKVISD